MPDELRSQMALIHEILQAMKIPILELQRYEADDLLGHHVAHKRRALRGCADRDRAIAIRFSWWASTFRSCTPPEA